MSEFSTPHQPVQESEAHRLAEQLLTKPYQLRDALAFAASLSPTTQHIADEHKKKKDAERQELMSLPIEELRQRAAQQEMRDAAARIAHAERDKKKREEAALRKAKEAAARDASKFYNQPSSVADFKYWSAMDYWTFDEALALLMGKDPRVMTKEAIDKEIEPEFSLGLLGQPKPAKSSFIQQYEALRTVAERAEAMQPAQLRPLDVVFWAHRSGAIAPPTELAREIGDRLQRTQPKPIEPAPKMQPETAQAEETVSARTDAAVSELKRSALIQKHERAWPSVEADLRHANENGLSARAKAKRHGFWREEDALAWARENGKLTDASTHTPHAAHTPFGRVHRIDD